MASHHIVKGKDAVFSDFEADNRFSAFCFVLSDLFFRQVAAVVVIHRCLSCSHLLFAAFFQFFFGAVAVVGLSFIKEALYFFLVNVKAFGLAIRAVFSAHVNAFIPGKAQPFQGVFNIFFRFPGGTFQICIFNADQEGAACMAGYQPVE